MTRSSLGPNSITSPLPPFATATSPASAAKAMPCGS